MARVRNDWQFKRQFKKYKEIVKRQLPGLLEREIINESIIKGKSPVAPGRRFQKYSKSYTDRIPRIPGKGRSPVNLKLSGDLLDSFNVAPSRKGLKISFKDKKSVYHDEGTNKIPQRKMLPTRRGETFSVSINKRIKKLVDRIVKRIFTN